jgi:hypothetical protein
MLTSVAHQPSPPAPAGSYWLWSRAPLSSLVIIIPLLAIYEVGLRMTPETASRSRVELWLREALAWLGFGGWLWLPLLTVAALLAWHCLTRQPWRMSVLVWLGMGAECLVLAAALAHLAHWEATCCRQLGIQAELEAPTAAVLPPSDAWTRRVAVCGAGVYEEIAFRLLLLPLGVLLLQRVGLSRRVSLLCGVIATSLLFAAAHHLGSSGEAWSAQHFALRTGVGLALSGVFLGRGLGVAAGTHTAYDLLLS